MSDGIVCKMPTSEAEYEANVDLIVAHGPPYRGPLNAEVVQRHMTQEHERWAGSWFAAWAELGNIHFFRCYVRGMDNFAAHTAGAITALQQQFDNLAVDVKRLEHRLKTLTWGRV